MKEEEISQFQDNNSEYHPDSYVDESLSEQQENSILRKKYLQEKADRQDRQSFATKEVPARSLSLASLTLEQRLALGVGKEELYALGLMPCEAYLGPHDYHAYKDNQEKIFIFEQCAGNHYKLRLLADNKKK